MNSTGRVLHRPWGERWGICCLYQYGQLISQWFCPSLWHPVALETLPASNTKTKNRVELTGGIAPTMCVGPPHAFPKLHLPTSNSGHLCMFPTPPTGCLLCLFVQNFRWNSAPSESGRKSSHPFLVPLEDGATCLVTVPWLPGGGAVGMEVLTFDLRVSDSQHLWDWVCEMSSRMFQKHVKCNYGFSDLAVQYCSGYAFWPENHWSSNVHLKPQKTSKLFTKYRLIDCSFTPRSGLLHEV